MEFKIFHSSNQQIRSFIFKDFKEFVKKINFHFIHCFNISSNLTIKAFTIVTITTIVKSYY